MSISLPDFDHSLALSQGNLDAASLAECHGIACGLLVRQPAAAAESFLLLLEMLEVLRDPGPALQELLGELFDATAAQMLDEEMAFALWLPEDDSSLVERTTALAQWCEGFLAALGSGQDERLRTLSGEAGEALADLSEIALADVAGDADADPSSLELEEQSFAEIVEYVRVAVLILCEDLRAPRQGEAIH